jgi:hypothetical protein
MDIEDKDDNDKRHMLEGKNFSYKGATPTIDFQATPPSWPGVVFKQKWLKFL